MMDSHYSTMDASAKADSRFFDVGSSAKKLLDLDLFTTPKKVSNHADSDGYTNVLLVDDCPLDRKLIHQLIVKSDNFYNISEADTIGAAVLMVADSDYDILLLDYRLPDGVGPEHIDDLREAANNFHLPIIVLTGHGDEHTAIESFKVGASDYMPKDDMSTSSLSRALSNALQNAKLQSRINEQRRAMIEANELLKAQNREINSFYQTVSHELKTPLTGAREYAALVRDGVVGEVSEEQKELLLCSIECCDSLKILVDDLLDAAEFESDSMRISLQRCTVKDIIDSALSCIALLDQNKSAKIDFSCEDDLPMVNVDKTRISQVISNIVNNAVKFSSKESQVNLAASYDAVMQQVRVDIADDGPGISEDLAEKVFEKFYQVKENTCLSYSGMGLGLYLCKKIIDAHGGSLSLASTEGVGSVFTFTLPCVDQ